MRLESKIKLSLILVFVLLIAYIVYSSEIVTSPQIKCERFYEYQKAPEHIDEYIFYEDGSMRKEYHHYGAEYSETEEAGYITYKDGCGYIHCEKHNHDLLYIKPISDDEIALYRYHEMETDCEEDEIWFLKLNERTEIAKPE